MLMQGHSIQKMVVVDARNKAAVKQRTTHRSLGGRDAILCTPTPLQNLIDKHEPFFGKGRMVNEPLTEKTFGSQEKWSIKRLFRILFLIKNLRKS